MVVGVVRGPDADLYTVVIMESGVPVPLIITAFAAPMVVLLVVWVWARRAVVRRIQGVGARLGEDQGLVVEGRGGLERAMGQLERSAEQAQLRIDSARADRNRLSGAFAELADGVIVVDE